MQSKLPQRRRRRHQRRRRRRITHHHHHHRRPRVPSPRPRSPTPFIRASIHRPSTPLVYVSHTIPQLYLHVCSLHRRSHTTSFASRSVKKGIFLLMYKLILLNMLVANKTTSHTIPQLYLYTSFASRSVPKKGLVVVVVTVRRRHITQSTPIDDPFNGSE